MVIKDAIDLPRPSVVVSPKSTVVILNKSNDIVPLGDTVPGVFQTLFRYQNKHITTMLNSISLSTDMKTLYLIDNGKAVAYDLTVPQGVLIGLLNNQLVVATAVSPPLETNGIDADISQQAKQSNGGQAGKYTFQANKDSQYTLIYNDENQTLGIIGYDDIDPNIGAPDEDSCKEHRFKLKENKVVHLLYKEKALEAYEG